MIGIHDGEVPVVGKDGWIMLESSKECKKLVTTATTFGTCYYLTDIYPMLLFQSGHVTHAVDEM